MNELHGIYLRRSSHQIPILLDDDGVAEEKVLKTGDGCEHRSLEARTTMTSIPDSEIDTLSDETTHKSVKERGDNTSGYNKKEEPERVKTVFRSWPTLGQWYAKSNYVEPRETRT